MSRRTAIVGVSMYDLGIIMDALYEVLGWSEPPKKRLSKEVDALLKADTERLVRQVFAILSAMNEIGEPE